MINPSINGWIEKYFIDCKIDSKIDEELFYNQLFQSGFVFGNIVNYKFNNLEINNELTDSELSKIVYLDAFFIAFYLNRKTLDKDKFVTITNSFFEALIPSKNNFINKFLPKNTAVIDLENTIDGRIYINENNISKKFSTLITNAFLFIDLLAFQRFLNTDNIANQYLHDLEQLILNIVTLALKSKVQKSLHDDLLIKLFESSIKYSSIIENKIQTIDGLNLNFITTVFEKKYLVAIASLTIWSDKKIENNEFYFLQKLAEKLKLDSQFVTKKVNQTENFIDINRKNFKVLNTANPVKSFYDQTSQTVIKLIVRNKKRLGKEISQSKELMKLVAISTKRDLDDIEKKKVKKQLLDICKTIPSLTIFLIPGGTLLLPILIKFIPQLLPSSFNENLEDEK